jgi:serine/threonine protein kinase
MNAATNITRAGTFVGTPAYSAPEQIRGEKWTAAPTIFALGVILYEMLSGEQAFEGQRTIEVLKATIQREPVAIEKLNRDVPPALADLLRWMIAKDMKESPGDVRGRARRTRAHPHVARLGHAGARHPPSRRGRVVREDSRAFFEVATTCFSRAEMRETVAPGEV